MHSRQGFGVRGGVIKLRSKRTVALRLTVRQAHRPESVRGTLCVLMLTVLVLAVVGCSGSKVTTKASAELPRYQIRTIALVLFTTLATPQVRDVVDQTLSAPPGARRSDMAISVPPNTEQPLRQTVAVPTDAGDIVTQLLWSRLRTRQGVTVLPPSEAAKVLTSPATSQPSAVQPFTATLPSHASSPNRI